MGAIKHLYDSIKFCFADRKIMRELLPVGLICLLGRKGAGKTQSMVAMMSNDYEYHGKERYAECVSYNHELNKNGFDLSPPPNACMYFSARLNPFILGNKRKVETWSVDPDRLALPNLDFDVQYLSLGLVLLSVLVVAGCRDWDTLTPYLIALAKYARHWDLTVIIDMKVFLQVDVAIRRLMMYTVFVYERYETKKLWFKSKIVWNWVWVDNQLNAFAKDLSSMLSKNKVAKRLLKTSVQNKRYVFKNKYHIYNRYRTDTGQMYFLYRIKDFDYINHEPFKLDPEVINKFVDSNPIVRPEEVKKRKKKEN